MLAQAAGAACVGGSVPQTAAGAAPLSAGQARRYALWARCCASLCEGGPYAQTALASSTSAVRSSSPRPRTASPARHDRPQQGRRAGSARCTHAGTAARKGCSSQGTSCVGTSLNSLSRHTLASLLRRSSRPTQDLKVPVRRARRHAWPPWNAGPPGAQILRHSSSLSAADIAQSQPPPPFATPSSQRHGSSHRPHPTPREPLRGIDELMQLPDLLDLPLRVPKDPIVLCHGLYGFDVRGPFFGLEIHYWAKISDLLRNKIGVEVITKGVPGTGSIKERAEALHAFLCSPAAGVQGRAVHFIGHSMGGLDARYLISNIRPTPDQYTPLTLTTIAAPHRGSPFMDWCNANVGIGSEFIEMEIDRARKEGLIPPAGSRRGNGSSPAAVSPSGSSTNGEAAAHTASLEQPEEDDIPRPPFSLKTPLLVRRKPSNGNDNGNGQGNGSESSSSDAASSPKEQTSEGLVDAAASAKDALAGSSALRASAAEPGQGDGASKRGHASEAAEEGFRSVFEGSDKSKGAAAAAATKAASEQLKTEQKKEDLGVFSRLLSNVSGSFSNFLLSAVDQPAYAMLSTRYMTTVFNPTTPNEPSVRYFSVAARTRKLPVWHPLWLPKLILDAAAESRTSGGESDGSGDALGGDLQGNDGIVSVRSAKWGEFLGIVEGCDHWDLRGGGAPRLKGNINPITGRPYVTKSEVEAKTKDDGKEQSWMDINRVVRSILGSKKETKSGSSAAPAAASPGPMQPTSATATPRESESSKSKADNSSEVEGEPGLTVSLLQDSASHLLPEALQPEKVRDAAVSSSSAVTGFLHEVAGWISERLPQGDEGRRITAELKAEEQERLTVAVAASLSAVQQAPPSDEARLAARSQDETVVLQPLDDPLPATMAGLVPEEIEHAAAAAPPNAVQSPFAPSEATLRVSPAAPAMARVDEHVPSHPVDSASSADPPRTGASKAESSTSESRKKLTKGDEQLEIFWIAICRHLWAQGY